MQSLRYVLVDVFSAKALSGNPVAVFTNGMGLSTDTMQALARELNLSETTFVLPGGKEFHAAVRIFTPTRELSFAGHPTLGTAAVLANAMESTAIQLRLPARPLTVKIAKEGHRIAGASLSYPAPSGEAVDHGTRARLSSALGLDLTQGGLPASVERSICGPKHILITVADRSLVTDLTPNLAELASLDVAVSVFAMTGVGEDVRIDTRMFAPAYGVPEDPATGSAAIAIASCLHRHGSALDQTVTIHQGTEIHRPSEIDIKVFKDDTGTLGVEMGGPLRIVALELA